MCMHKQFIIHYLGLGVGSNKIFDISIMTLVVVHIENVSHIARQGMTMAIKHEEEQTTRSIFALGAMT